MSAKAADRVKKIVDELLTTRIADLSDRAQTERRLAELTTSLGEVESFARSVEALLGGLPRAKPGTGAPRLSRIARRRGRPRSRVRRGPGEFNATPFILKSVQVAGKGGIRPREIVQQVVTAAPGHHVRPSALVSTILTRLKRKGEVRRRAGKWFPA